MRYDGILDASQWYKVMKQRHQMRVDWLKKNLPDSGPLLPLAGDASFRCYFRVSSRKSSYVLMDVPPQDASSRSFVAVAHAFSRLGLSVPHIYAVDFQQGFLLLSDLGDRLLLRELNQKTVDQYYSQALESLLLIQTCREIEGYDLPLLDDDFYSSGLSLFSDWYLERHLARTLSTSDRQALNTLAVLLRESAVSQPQVCVHRDYHSKNLIVISGQRLGILDFQDAAWGPITYDLVSLLYDCYIDWPSAEIRNKILYFYRRLLAVGVLDKVSFRVFLKWCDWTVVQRHLRCLGVFARLYYRDNKPAYLQAIPRTRRYLLSVCGRYSVFSSLLRRFLC